jgi:hypothetical protein
MTNMFWGKEYPLKNGLLGILRIKNTAVVVLFLKSFGRKSRKRIEIDLELRELEKLRHLSPARSLTAP